MTFFVIALSQAGQSCSEGWFRWSGVIRWREAGHADPAILHLGNTIKVAEFACGNAMIELIAPRTPNADFFLERMKDKGILVKQFPEHIAVRTPEHNVALLSEAGFRIEHVRLLPHYNILKVAIPCPMCRVSGNYSRRGYSSKRSRNRHMAAVQSPDLPPCFSSTRTLVITIRRSAALHMS